MKTCLLPLLFLLFFFSSKGQSGNFGDGSDGSVTITSSTILAPKAALLTSLLGDTCMVDSTTGFSSGTPVLIIQMTNAGAGKSEYATVVGVGYKKLWFSGLVNTYKSNATQIIKLPQYQTLSIGANGELSSNRYNDLTGKGGVLCFLVKNGLTIADGGKLSMNGKGFQCSSIPGTPGTGGLGGLGGIPTLGVGGNGGAFGSGSRGVFNGGQGGFQGFPGLAGGAVIPFGCPIGISDSSFNRSNATGKIFLMGTSGLPGKAGDGGSGAGGGGAGSGNGSIPGNIGQLGGVGGTGGVGGAGGLRGGGLIMFKALIIDYLGSGLVYEVKGDTGENGATGSIGGVGGFGAPGINFNPCFGTGGSGGGGNGAKGGQGGSGGSAAAGGYVYIIKSLSNRNIAGTINSKSKGGLAGLGGLGGAGGQSIPTLPSVVTPCPPSGIGGGGAIGSGSGSNFYNYSCNLSILAPIALGNSFGTGYYSGTMPNGNPFVCSLDSLYQVGNLSYFQITLVETDLLTGNNFYTNMVIANQLGLPTSGLIGLIDAGGSIFPNYIGNPPNTWISACTGFIGQQGLNGGDGQKGEDGEGSGSEDFEFPYIPLSFNQLSLRTFPEEMYTRLYWEFVDGSDKMLHPKFVAESISEQGQFSVFQDHIKGVLVGEKYAFNLKVPETEKDQLFRVRAQLDNGEVLLSNMVRIKGSKSVFKVDVFPNPNLDGVLKFRVEGYKPDQLVVKLTGLSSGKTVTYNIPEGQPLQIDVRDIANGIYSFEAFENGKKFTISKVIILR